MISHNLGCSKTKYLNLLRILGIVTILSLMVMTIPATPAMSTTPVAFSVTSYRFSPNPITLGNTVIANISIYGGSAGAYTLGIWKDITLAPDQLIISYSINHSGNTTDQSFSFTPTSAGKYHLGLIFNGTTLWSQPNDSSRLVVTAPTSPAFSLTSYNFSPNPIILGQVTAASVAFTGGSAGTYTLGIWKDIDLAPDQLVNSYPINYSGNTTNQSFSFTPTSAGRYHLNLIYNNATLWSQPDDSSRLTVSNPAPSVKIENVDVPSVVTVGQTYNYNVTLKNYSSSQATVSLSIDSSTTGHMSTTSVTLPANTSKNVPITATFTPAGVRTVTYTVLYNNETLDSLTKTVEAKTAATVSVTDWRKNIQIGDILLSRSQGLLGELLALIGSNDFWTHTAIYVGDGKIVEAIGTGVKLTSITDWDYPNKTCVEVRRVKEVDTTKISKVIGFISSQIGKPYSYYYLDKSYSPNTISWYCSELVWAAYMQVGINIEYTPDEWVVSPQEIADDEDTYLIGSHEEDIPSNTTLKTLVLTYKFLSIFLFSPVDVVVTDPDGLIVSAETCQIPGAIYAADDFKGDGHIETIVSIPDKKSGDYKVQVIPKPNALSTDTYSLKAQLTEQTVDLANNVQIGNIPTQSYRLMVGIAPGVSTNKASSIGSYDACLNGELTSLGTADSARVSFERGTVSGNYISETAVQEINTTGTFNFSLGNLSPNITYYFRAKVETTPTSSKGDSSDAAFSDYTCYGAEEIFTTSATPLDTTSSHVQAPLLPPNQPAKSISWILITVILVVMAIIGAAIITWRYKAKHQ